MARELAGMRIAIIATDGVERVELEQPRGALYGAGASTDLLSIHPGETASPGVERSTNGLASRNLLHPRPAANGNPRAVAIRIRGFMSGIVSRFYWLSTSTT